MGQILAELIAQLCTLGLLNWAGPRIAFGSKISKLVFCY